MANLQSTTIEGNLNIGGDYPYLPGHVANVYYFGGGPSNVSVGTNSSGKIVPDNIITVSEGSRLYVACESGQIHKTLTNSNPRLSIRINGSRINNDDNHKWYGSSNVQRVWLLSHGITGPLSAGSYTLNVYGETYNNPHTFNYQNTNRIAELVVMEILED